MYSPVFEGPIQGYVANSINSHRWKVAPLYDRDDLMQEAYLVFLRCASRYPVIDTPQHFMALFKTAWSNHVITLAKKTTSQRRTVSENMFDREDGETYRRETPGDLNNDGELVTLLRQAPREVMMVLNLFLSAPTEILELATSTWQKQSRRGADPNEFVRSALGLPADSRPIDAVRDYLSR